MRKKAELVYGVGRNDADYPVVINVMIGGKRKRIRRCPIYEAWSGMLKRCYSAKYQAKYPTYIGCLVTPEWLSFSAFRPWMLAHDHDGKELDKDILRPGNKIYSPDSCVLVSSQLNMFITDSGAARGEWPTGVCWKKGAGKFHARCCDPFTGKREHLGYFTDPAEAHEAWRKRKHEHACAYADQQTDPRIAKALRTRYANKLEGEIA